jgi:hypothetical protein
MATLRKPIAVSRPDANVFPDLIDNQVTATNEFKNFVAYVMADGGADEGVYASFDVPENYASAGKVIVRGIIDGTAANTLGIGVKGLARADNEAGDTAFGSEDPGSISVVSYADEDHATVSVTLTNLGTLAAKDQVYLYVYVDSSVTSYTGNFLLTGLYFEYTST